MGKDKPQRDTYQKDLNMKKMKNLIALTTVMALCFGQVQGQEPEYVDDCSAAYCDCGKASYMSALLPIGALVVAAILIATTNRHHHHHSSGSDSSSSSSSSSHYGSSSSSSFSSY